MYDKVIDPRDTREWKHPDNPEYIITYGPASGVFTSEDPEYLMEKLIRRGVRKFTINGERQVPPKGYDWTHIIPAEVQGIVSVLIFDISNLGERERKNSNAPLGSPSSESGVVEPASGETGSAPQGVTTTN